jgi:hypothetical protein
VDAPGLGLLLGDVREDADVVADRALLVAHRGDALPDGDDAAVAVAVEHLAFPVAALQQLAPEVLVEAERVLAGLHHAGVAAQHVGFLIAQDGGEGPVDLADAALGIGDQHRVEAGVEHGGGQAQLVLHLAAGGDVLHRAHAAQALARHRLQAGPQVDPAQRAVAGVDAELQVAAAPCGQRLHEGRALERRSSGWMAEKSAARVGSVSGEARSRRRVSADHFMRSSTGSSSQLPRWATLSASRKRASLASSSASCCLSGPMSAPVMTAPSSLPWALCSSTASIRWWR